MGNRGAVAPPEMIELAEEAGLTYLDDGTPGYRRVRKGKGFSYVDDGNHAADEEARARIQALSIPPAWKDVWIATNPSSHVLATGTDDAGRKQYIYHPVWDELRDDIKFKRLIDFGRRVGDLRRKLDKDLRQGGLPRDKVVALAVTVLDRTLIRVGNRKYANANDSYGLTTLTGDHVEVDGHHVNLEFSGKGGADYTLAFQDRRLAGLISKCQNLSGQTLFSYQNGNGLSAVASTDINDYLAKATRSHFTAKDFRTWGASTTVAAHLAAGGDDASEKAVLEAIDVAAERLGNTRAVCRTSYVHPDIPDAFLDGRLQHVWRESRSGRWLDREESAVNKLFQEAR